MEQEEILQYNKRCADFMGLEISIKLEDGYSCGTWYKPTDNENEFSPCPVMYHSDWNWIMEVVDAIVEKTKFKTIDECSEEEWYATIGITRLTITSKKEAVVQAINQFLIWYEQNKTI